MTRKERLIFFGIPLLFGAFNFLHWVIPDSLTFQGEAVDWLIFDSLNHLYGSYLTMILALGITKLSKLIPVGKFELWAVRLAWTFTGVQILQAFQVWSGFTAKGALDVAIVTAYFILSAIIALGIEAYRRVLQANRKQIGPRVGRKGFS